MYKSAPLLVTCLFGLSLAGCASITGSGHSPVVDEKTTSNTQEESGKTSSESPIEYADFEPETLYLLLSAEIAAQRGRYDVTLVNYLRAAQQSRDKNVIERAMRIAQSLNGDNAQKQLAELWLDVEIGRAHV